MPDRRAMLLQGTLDLLILKALSAGTLHRLGVSRAIEQNVEVFLSRRQRGNKGNAAAIRALAELDFVIKDSFKEARAPEAILEPRIS